MAVLSLTEKLNQLGTRMTSSRRNFPRRNRLGPPARFQKVAKHNPSSARSSQAPRFKQDEKDLAGAHQMFIEAEDAEMKQMAHDEEKELSGARNRRARAETPCSSRRIPSTTRASSWKSAPARRDEAALFAAELFRMYSRYAKRRAGKSKSSKLSASIAPQGSRRRDSRAESLFQTEI